MQAAGVDWTVVRASIFAQNFSEGLFLDGVLAGEIALPAGDVAEPFIDLDDLADVAVAALTEPGHTGQVYEVTGSRSFTFAEAAAEIAAASGRDVRYVPVTASEFEAMLVGFGLPDDEATGLTELFTVIFDGRNAHTSDGVERALGRPATGLPRLRPRRRGDRDLGDAGGVVTTLTVVTAVACGLVGGVFFAFSTFVMRGLRDAPPEAGLRAMQSINRAAPTPLFMLAFIGTADRVRRARRVVAARRCRPA